MNQQEKSPWQYKPDGGAEPSDGAAKPAEEVKPSPPAHARTAAWEAPEYISHPHGAGWYSALILATVGLAALIYLVAKDTVASVIIVLVGIIVGIFAAQEPSLAKYEISAAGLSINGKSFNYSNYKSFAVVREGPLTSVNLFPLKRLMPPLSAYFEPQEEQKVIEALGEYLPYEDRKLDNVERLARRLRL